MAKILNNAITSTFSGKLGDDFVFRRVGGRAFVVRKPENKKPPTQAQRRTRHSFGEAQMFAGMTMSYPEEGEWYSIVANLNGFKSAHRAAANDYMTKPEIESINTKGYKGNVGDVIHIKPKMLLKIRHIDISIYDANGELLESGQAIKNELNFKYKTTHANPHVEGTKIVLVAHDRLEKSCKVVEYLYG